MASKETTVFNALSLAFFSDGFQLMESGEQRHVNDVDREGAGAKFKSRLSGALRKDGVTRKL